MSHEEAGGHMGVSRATFGRIIQRAREGVADALINGKAINVEGGNYLLMDTARIFHCSRCDHEWEEPIGTGRPSHCPSCKNADFYRIKKKKDESG
jgi:predicted Zn-ribbon and HTH transcriptional regulator